MPLNKETKPNHSVLLVLTVFDLLPESKQMINIK